MKETFFSPRKQKILALFIRKTIDNNINMQVDSLCIDVFCLAEKISKETHGAFDITVTPLVNAWGFGFDSSTNVDSTTIDSLRQFVGFDKVSLLNGKIIKSDPRLKLACSSIAKKAMEWIAWLAYSTRKESKIT